MFRNLDRENLRTLEVLTLQLRGGANRIRLRDLAFDQPRGPAEGEPHVEGENQTGAALKIGGCQPEELFLMTGDYFTEALY